MNILKIKKNLICLFLFIFSLFSCIGYIANAEDSGTVSFTVTRSIDGDSWNYTYTFTPDGVSDYTYGYFYNGGGGTLTFTNVSVSNPAVYIHVYQPGYPSFVVTSDTTVTLQSHQGGSDIWVRINRPLLPIDEAAYTAEYTADYVNSEYSVTCDIYLSTKKHGSDTFEKEASSVASGTAISISYETAKCAAFDKAKGQLSSSSPSEIDWCEECDPPGGCGDISPPTPPDKCETCPVGSNSGEPFGSCISCSGGSMTLGAHYHVNLSSQDSEIGYGWRNDFDIKVGKLQNTDDSETYVLFKNGRKQYFIRKTDGTFASPKGSRAQIVNDGISDILKIKVEKTVYEFDVPSQYGNTGLKSALKSIQIITEINNAGIFEYSGRMVNFTYDATSGFLTKIENETGEFYTFNYNANGLLENVKNHAAEDQRTFVYDANRNLTSRWQKGLGTTTFTYSATTGEEHILTGINKPGGVNTTYNHHGFASSQDRFGNTLVYADYTSGENVYSGPQTEKIYHHVAGGRSYTEYKRPLRDDGGTMIYAVSTEYESEYVTHADYGEVIKNESLNENGSTTISYSSPDGTLWSQTVGTDTTTRTTINEYTASGDLKTVTRYTATVPANTWDMIYEYDSFKRVIKTIGIDGLEHHTSYISPTNGWDKRVFAKWDEKNGDVINKTVYEYYADTEPAYCKYRLWKQKQMDGTNTVSTITLDHVQTDNDNPQNVGKLWKKTYDDSSYEEFSYGCCDIATARNRNAGTTTYVRDAAGRLTSMTDASGAVTQYTYNTAGKTLTTTLPSGGIITNTYDPRMRVTNVAYPDSSTVSTTYREDDQMATQTKRTGLIVTNNYSDNDGMLTSVTTPDGTLQAVTYDGLGRELTVTDTRGLVLTKLYNDLGRNYKTVWPDTTYTEDTYNTLGQLTSRRDRLNYIVAFEYDDFGRNTAQVLPNGLRRDSVYDSLSRTTSTTLTDVSTTLTTTYTLNFEGRATGLALPDGTSKSMTYTNGLLTSVTDKAGKIWNATYTPAGQIDVVSAPDGLGTVSDTDYGFMGNMGAVSKITGTNGTARTFSYDNMGRVTRVTLDDGTYSLTEYGVSGLTAQINRSGRRTEFTYDNYGRRISVKDPKNQTITFGYNLAGDMTSMTDANSKVTGWAYNTEGKMITKTYADSSQYIYAYNANGKLLTRTDAKSGTTAYSYNNMGQLTGIDYPTDTDILYTYDDFGNKLTMTDASGTTTYSFDALKRPTGEDGPFASNDTIGYSYDTAGRHSNMAISNGGSPLVATDYTYDSMGRISTVGIPARDFSYSYLNTSNQILTQSRNAAEVVASSYDNLGRLTSKINKNSTGSVVNSYTYTLNNSDERTKVTFADGKYIDYTYDLAGQLTSAKRCFADENQDYSYNYGYNYDPMGNPLNRTSTGQSKNYTFNNLNQFASATAPAATDVLGTVSPIITEPKVKVNGQPAPGVEPDANGNWVVENVPLTEGPNALNVTTTDKFNRTDSEIRNVTLKAAPVFEFDPNGNMTSDGTKNFEWNEENRLISAEPITPVANDKKVEFVHDGMGRRRIRKQYNWNGTAWDLEKEERFVWNGFNKVAVLDGSNAVQKSMTWGIDLSGSMQRAGGVGGLLAVNDGANTYVPYYDGNGNITSFVDASTNATVATFEYGPFGKFTLKDDPLNLAEIASFSTKPYDPVLDATMYELRILKDGIWLSREPLGEAGSTNLYRFLANNPQNTVDYLGLIGWDDIYTENGNVYFDNGTYPMPDELVGPIDDNGNVTINNAHTINIDELIAYAESYDITSANQLIESLNNTFSQSGEITSRVIVKKCTIYIAYGHHWMNDANPGMQNLQILLENPSSSNCTFVGCNANVLDLSNPVPLPGYTPPTGLLSMGGGSTTALLSGGTSLGAELLKAKNAARARAKAICKDKDLCCDEVNIKFQRFGEFSWFDQTPTPRNETIDCGR